MDNLAVTTFIRIFSEIWQIYNFTCLTMKFHNCHGANLCSDYFSVSTDIPRKLNNDSPLDAKRNGVTPFIDSAFQIRSQTNSIEEYGDTLNEFSQRFLVSAWEDADNIVFSPFSLHSVIAMLTSGATNNSNTQNELLAAFGRSRNIQNIENSYEAFIDNFKKSGLDQVLTFANRLWTTKKHYQSIEREYLRKIRNFYGADLEKFVNPNPEKYINNWVREKTNNKINKIIGKYFLCLVLVSY